MGTEPATGPTMNSRILLLTLATAVCVGCASSPTERAAGTGGESGALAGAGNAAGGTPSVNGGASSLAGQSTGGAANVAGSAAGGSAGLGDAHGGASGASGASGTSGTSGTGGGANDLPLHSPAVFVSPKGLDSNTGT